MANKVIKGLTVEIGGDTTKLGAAIDAADTKSRQLSYELGQVNKLLKFDDANPELLAQKQKILTDQIEQTKEKLEILQQVQDQATAAFERGKVSEEQMRALQREIIAAEGKLGNYKNAVDETADKLSKLGDASKNATQPAKTLSELTKEQETTLSDLKKSYADIAAAQGKYSDEAQALAAQINELSSELAENKSKLNDAKKAADNYDNTIVKAVEPQKALRQIVDEQKKALEQLKAEYSETAAAQGINSASAKALSKQIESLSGELNDNQNKLTQADDEADKFDKTIDDLGDSAEDTEKDFSALTNTLGACLKAAAAVTGAVATAAVGMTAKVVNAYGELEQNLGGAEAVFNELGDSIDSMTVRMQTHDEETGKVIETTGTLAEVSEAAYKTMGISQSDYLANLNKMGALFQGSGLEQQEALDLSAQAMQRAADVASVMGIDISAALESVTGAAKGNFTMMDNLGVAMNATTLEAYALKNGLIAESEASVDVKKVADAQDKARKATLDVEKAQISYNAAVAKYGENSEQAQKALISLEKTQVSLETATRHVDEAMAGADESSSSWWKNASNADKARVAMQMFLETTEQYDGNFAREATETISGSFGLLNSALDSLIAGLGNGEADIENLTGNVVDAFLSVTENIIPVVETMGAALPQAVSTLVDGAKDELPYILPILTNTLAEIIESLVDAVPEISAELLKMILQLAPTIFSAVTSLLTQLLRMLISMAPEILHAVLQVARDIITELSAVLPELLAFAAEIIPELVLVLLNEMPALIECGLTLLTALVSALPEIIAQICAVLPRIIDSISSTLLLMLPQIIRCGITLLTSLVKELPQVIVQICSMLPQIITSVVNTLTSMLPMLIDCGMQLFLSLIDALPEVITQLADNMPQIIDSIIATLLSMLPQLIDCGIQLFVALIQAMPEIIAEIVNVVPQIVSAIVDAFRERFGQIRDVGKNLIEGLWDGIQDMAGWIHDKIVGFGDGVLNSLKDFFGIASPSKVFRDQIGKNLSLGLADGIAEESGAAVDAVQKMADEIADVEFDSRRLDFASSGTSLDDNPLVFERNLREQWYANQPEQQIVIFDPSMMSRLDSILSAIERGQVLMLDGDALVGGTADRMNTALGMIEITEQRR